MDRPLKIGGEPTFSFLFFPFYNLVVVKKGHELLNYTSTKRGQFCLALFPLFLLFPLFPPLAKLYCYTVTVVNIGVAK